MNHAKDKNINIAEELNIDDEIITAIGQLFDCVFVIDIIDNHYEEVSSNGRIYRLVGRQGQAQEKLNELCSKYVLDDYYDVVKRFVDLSTINDRLRDVNDIIEQYPIVGGYWREDRFVVKRRDENGDVIQVLMLRSDITSQKQKEITQNELLKAACEAAEAANHAKSDFLFRMSHDIRTPMNAIMGYTDLMERFFGDREKCWSYLSKIKSSSEFLLELINNVLEMARIESNNTTVDEVVIKTEDIYESLKSVYDELMSKHNIEFHTSMEFVTPNIYCDTVKTKEIFLNILSNAQKYTPSGGRVSMDVREIPAPREGYVLIKTTISDTGIGMSEEFLPHIFEDFSREKTSIENGIQGTGLGMPIVSKLVKLLGGVIEVQSKLGEGSTFTVTLPHRIAYVETKEKIEINKTIEYDSFEGKRILLVEDNEFNTEIATMLLTGAGFEIEHAGDGQICIDMLEKVEKDYYDLILMDIQMPNLNGYDATRIIRESGNDIPIIAMTANAFEKDKQDAFDAGMNGHIAKPIKVKNLLEELGTVFSK